MTLGVFEGACGGYSASVAGCWKLSERALAHVVYRPGHAVMNVIAQLNVPCIVSITAARRSRLADLRERANLRR